MPRASDFVSDSVWRVPNDTSLRMSDSMRSADGAVPMSCSSACMAGGAVGASAARTAGAARQARSEEHTSELQSLMRISYAVFCLKKKIQKPMGSSDHKLNPQHICTNLVHKCNQHDTKPR